jgi:hypothetical protein
MMQCRGKCNDDGDGDGDGDGDCDDDIYAVCAVRAGCAGGAGCWVYGI